MIYTTGGTTPKSKAYRIDIMGGSVITKSEVFLYYVKSNDYLLTDCPFFMILDEEGNVKHMVENLLVG